MPAAVKPRIGRARAMIRGLNASWINMPFTAYSPKRARMAAIGRDIRRDRVFKAMTIVARFIGIAVAVREFLAPTYRPERHYMRGPGPACARARGFR